MTSMEAGTPRRSLLARALLAVVGLYQRTAALRQPRCRFYPSCSQYAVESIEVHGALRGSVYATGRVLRCHPWHEGGIDPVKPRKS